MRLAIDLQACQQGAAEATATVTLVRAVVAEAQAAGHTVLLLLHHAWNAPAEQADQADALRQALALPWQAVSAVSAVAAPGQVQLQVLDTPRGGGA